MQVMATCRTHKSDVMNLFAVQKELIMPHACMLRCFAGVYTLAAACGCTVYTINHVNQSMPFQQIVWCAAPAQQLPGLQSQVCMHVHLKVYDYSTN